MMINKSIILSVFYMLFANTIFAAPQIDTISGTYSHGSEVTINGSGFGSKATQGPTVWDNCETGNIKDKWDTIYPYAAANPDYNMQYRTDTFRNVPQAHVHSQQYAVGGHCPLNGTWGNNMGPNVMLNAIVGTSSNFYASCYARLDPLWPNTNDNHKAFNSSDQALSYAASINNVFYLTYNVGGTEDNHSYAINTYQGGVAQWSRKAADLRQGWVKIEIICDRDEYVKIYENGVKVYEGTGNTTSDGANRFGFGYFKEAGDYNAFRYFDDLYYDKTFSRIIIGNDPVFDNCTIREIQPPINWSDNSITFTLNQGAFLDGDTAYVFIVDQYGEVNANGQAITLDGESYTIDDTTPPLAPSGINLTVE